MAEFLPQVLSLTGQLKRACKAPSHASHHNQQIAKLLGRLEVLLGDLEDAPAGKVFSRQEGRVTTGSAAD